MEKKTYEKDRNKKSRDRKYNNGNASDKLKKRVHEIFRKCKIHTPRDQPNTVPVDFLDTLLQKLLLPHGLDDTRSAVRRNNKTKSLTLTKRIL